MSLNRKISACMPMPAGRGIINVRMRYGIELEFESGQLLTNVPGWEFKYDGSLRDNGIEMTSLPLAKKNLDKTLATAQIAITEYHFQATPRCGVHIHQNMRQCTVGDLFALIVGYALVEPGIFQTIAPDRVTSSFCVPLWEDALKIKQGRLAVQACRAPDPINTGSLMNLISTSKYSAMNWRSLGQFGTVEYRLHPATTDMSEVKEWIMLLDRLHSFCTSFSDPLDVLGFYEGHGRNAFYRKIFNRNFAVPARQQQRAEEAATFLAGYIEPSWQTLSWSHPQTEVS